MPSSKKQQSLPKMMSKKGRRTVDDSNDNRVDLSSTNKKKKELKLPKINNLLKKQAGPSRDEAGKFTSGSGGLRIVQNFNFKRALPIVAVVALVGGYFVWQSFAAVVQYSGPTAAAPTGLPGTKYTYSVSKCKVDTGVTWNSDEKCVQYSAEATAWRAYFGKGTPHSRDGLSEFDSKVATVQASKGVSAVFLGDKGAHAPKWKDESRKLNDIYKQAVGRTMSTEEAGYWKKTLAYESDGIQRTLINPRTNLHKQIPSLTQVASRVFDMEESAWNHYYSFLQYLQYRITGNQVTVPAPIATPSGLPGKKYTYSVSKCNLNTSVTWNNNEKCVQYSADAAAWRVFFGKGTPHSRDGLRDWNSHVSKVTSTNGSVVSLMTNGAHAAKWEEESKLLNSFYQKFVGRTMSTEEAGYWKKTLAYESDGIQRTLINPITNTHKQIPSLAQVAVRIFESEESAWNHHYSFMQYMGYRQHGATLGNAESGATAEDGGAANTTPESGNPIPRFLNRIFK